VITAEGPKTRLTAFLDRNGKSIQAVLEKFFGPGVLQAFMAVWRSPGPLMRKEVQGEDVARVMSI